MVGNRFVLLASVGVLAVLAGAAWQSSRADGAPSTTVVSSAAKDAPWSVPDIDKLPNDVWGKTVRYGRDLIDKTPSLIGPDVSDVAMRFSGNNLSCQNCHIASGTVKFGQPLIGVFADFPTFIARTGSVGTMEDRIQGCMERSMNGKQLPLGSAEMIALVSYMKFLSTGRPVGGATVGRGSGRIRELTRAADPVRGRTIYANTCAACHGAQGQGQRNGKVGDAKGYLFPPLWGPDSFNDGAGMNQLIDAANFLHSDMPAGTTWNNPTLSPEDSWDVAAYVVSQPRPLKSGLDKDYPNKLDKPVDTPYGPYADGFSEEQHKYGPFAPIRAAIEKLKAAETTAKQ